MKLLFNRQDGRILGLQAIAEEGVERRVDVVAFAIQNGGSVFDLEEAELCYAPQYGAAKDPVNVCGIVAANVVRGDLELADCANPIRFYLTFANRQNVKTIPLRGPG